MQCDDIILEQCDTVYERILNHVTNCINVSKFIMEAWIKPKIEAYESSWCHNKSLS